MAGFEGQAMLLPASRQKLLIVLALGALYFIWGSTFLAMRFAIESFPPFMMAAIRFVAAGALLYGWLRWRGTPVPTFKQWLGAAIVGVLLLSIGNAGVAYAEQSVSSGAAALAIATVPLWAAIFASFWKHAPNRREWLGIVIGTVGIVVLNLGTNMQASPLGAGILLLSAACWAFGSLWGKHLPMPEGAMASAAQMLMGGAVLVGVSLMTGETWPESASPKSIYALAYLIVFGSLIAYSAYLFLLNAVRPALATSYAFVNPVVALALGAWLAGEVIGRAEYIALAIIVVGVLLVLPLKRGNENT
ncbi:MAG TPA: drug/metabolite exporter YedA [Methylophilaceae bacterium]|nr:drug/metabolite exporter YedA [Methylophilaceae bacterium]